MSNNINNFIDLFLEDGLFHPYLDKVYGIATHNFQLRIFNVTFKESTPKQILDNLYNTFSEPEIITIKDDQDLSIQINRPQGFRQLVTLYPMPFEITNDVILEITKSWGNCYMKSLANIRNAPHTQPLPLSLY